MTVSFRQMSEEADVKVSWSTVYRGGRHSCWIADIHDRMQCMHRRCSSAVLGVRCMEPTSENDIQDEKVVSDITRIACIPYKVKKYGEQNFRFFTNLAAHDRAAAR
jgi:hypothetical protein